MVPSDRIFSSGRLSRELSVACFAHGAAVNFGVQVTFLSMVCHGLQAQRWDCQTTGHHYAGAIGRGSCELQEIQCGRHGDRTGDKQGM